MLAIRRDQEIHAEQGGWFSARWHFSFGGYFDPDQMGLGPLRVFNDDRLVPGAIWPMHPHRDVEGITWVVAGEFEHADSLGNDGVLLPGGAQRMRLGSGALHSERNHSQTNEMQFIQIWILPETRGLEPGNVQKQYTEADRADRLLRFLKPERAAGEGLDVAADVSMYASRLNKGRALRHEFGARRGGYLYLIEGALTANGSAMKTGDAAYVTAAGALEITADATSELLVVDTPLS
jgi:quercetin 2,3-dioxygenase